MRRFVDRGANVAAVVGVGMALTIAVSFLMVIPIDPAYLVLAPLSGLLIGWYGNQRAEQLRSRPGRVLANAAWSGLITGVTFALLFLAVKLFFFSLDPGYRDEERRRAHLSGRPRMRVRAISGGRERRRRVVRRRDHRSCELYRLVLGGPDGERATSDWEHAQRSTHRGAAVSARRATRRVEGERPRRVVVRGNSR